MRIYMCIYVIIINFEHLYYYYYYYHGFHDDDCTGDTTKNILMLIMMMITKWHSVLKYICKILSTHYYEQII